MDPAVVPAVVLPTILTAENLDLIKLIHGNAAFIYHPIPESQLQVITYVADHPEKTKDPTVTINARDRTRQAAIARLDPAQPTQVILVRGAYGKDVPDALEKLKRKLEVHVWYWMALGKDKAEQLLGVGGSREQEHPVRFEEEELVNLSAGGGEKEGRRRLVPRALDDARISAVDSTIRDDGEEYISKSRMEKGSFMLNA